MRKLKKISLSQSQILSDKDMEILAGGDTLTRFCRYRYTACALVYEGVVYTGTCNYPTSGDYQDQLVCIPN